MPDTSFSKDKMKVVLLEGVHASAVEAFRSDGYSNIDLHQKALPEPQLVEAARDAYIVGIRSATQLTRGVLEASRHLTAIGCFCIGTNQVDLAAAQDRGIPVFNAPFSNTRSVAELVLAEIVLLMRGIPGRNAAAHRGEWIKTAAGSREARGKTLGIVGYGHIGTQVGVLAEALGMHVVFYDIEMKLALGNARAMPTLAALLEAADVVTLHVPETAETTNLIDAAAIAHMKQGASLINASRGHVVDIDALVCALDSKDLFALPKHASFALVTGCQMAHTTCLAAARSWLLEKHGWDVERQGLAGSPPIKIFCGVRHATIDRALRLLGFGDESLHPLATNHDGSLDPAALENALKDSAGSPTLVLLQAGDVNTGGFDDFETLIPIAKKYGAWTHIDAAFGLYVAVSPRYKHWLSGAEKADSWATDGHKWLNVPYDCGYAFVAQTDAHRRSMSYQAHYLSHQTEARDPLDWNPEFSRRARGFASYAALRELGRNGVREMVERNCECAAAIVEGLSQLENVEVLFKPIINQGLVAFLDPSGKPSDEWNERMIAEIVKEGTSFFSGTTWNGRRAMRVSVSNWQTSLDDVSRTIEGVKRAMNVLYPTRHAAIK